MFAQRTEFEYDAMAEAGTRHLFQLNHFEFRDTLDEEGVFHHVVLELADDEVDAEPAIYETDQATMYELMARFLAGEYEKKEYTMDRSPAHEALLDLLEEGTARARAGDQDIELFNLDEEFEEVEEDLGPEGDDER